MGYHLPERIERDLIAAAHRHAVSRITLFGSRARGDNATRSDVDIAVCGGDFDAFYDDVQENAYTLLTFDIVEDTDNMSEELRREIQRDGIVIYEKGR